MGLASRPPFAILALPLAAVLLAAAPAGAFCRSTTCTGDCPRDENGCKTTGAKLSWPGKCVGYSIQRDGTANLPMEQVKPTVEAAFAAWSAVECGGQPLSLALKELAEVSCHEAAYDENGPNANTVMFQDTRWKYHGPDDTLAKTTVTFDNETGEIFDADLEINYAYNEFTVGDDHVVYDLLSVVTHEAGHFIGLDHTLDPDATMNAGYDVDSTQLRTLEADDVTGICAVYPPGRSATCDPTPRNGLADACAPKENSSGGCASSPRAPAGMPAALLGLVLSWIGARAARRARRS